MPEDTRHTTPVSLWSPIRLAYGLLPVVSLLDQRGVKTTRMLEQAGIDRFGLMDPGYTISIEQELSFFKAAMKACPAPGFSLDVAREYHLRGFSVLGLAMQASATPLAMLQLIMRYPRLAWGMFDGVVVTDADTLRIRFRPQPRLGEAEGFLAERDFGCAVVLFDEASERPYPFEAVRFRHACPGDAAIYEDFFRCPVHFEAGHTELVSRRETAEQALPQANPVICAFYTAQCQRMARNMDQPFLYANAVRNRLLSSDSIPALNELASRMLLTPRTLQRRLRDENVSFSELLREVRQQRAMQLLSEGNLNMEQIANRLGFSDAVAFSHAFKAWTGQSPQRWRKAQAA